MPIKRSDSQSAKQNAIEMQTLGTGTLARTTDEQTLEPARHTTDQTRYVPIQPTPSDQDRTISSYSAPKEVMKPPAARSSLAAATSLSVAVQHSLPAVQDLPDFFETHLRAGSLSDRTLVRASLAQFVDLQRRLPDPQLNELAGQIERALAAVVPTGDLLQLASSLIDYGHEHYHEPDLKVLLGVVRRLIVECPETEEQTQDFLVRIRMAYNVMTRCKSLPLNVPPEVEQALERLYQATNEALNSLPSTLNNAPISKTTMGLGNRRVV